jgi:hypothetical protein
LHTLKNGCPPRHPLQATTALDAARAELRVKVAQQAEAAAPLEKEEASRKARLQKLQEELDAAAAANRKLQMHSTAAEKEHRQQLDSLKAELAAAIADKSDMKHAVR